jgi:hypothetical protein
MPVIRSALTTKKRSTPIHPAVLIRQKMFSGKAVTSVKRNGAWYHRTKRMAIPLKPSIVGIYKAE